MNQSTIENNVVSLRARNRQSRQSRIRDVSLRLFAEKGFDRTSLKDIADELGITHPALYYYYRSKNDILFDAVSMTMHELVDTLQQALEAGSDDDPEPRLRRLAESQIVFQLKVKGLIPLVDSVLFGPLSAAKVIDEPGRRELIGIQRQLTRLYRREIDAGVEAGVFSVENPAAACFSLLGTISYVVYWFRENGPNSREEVAQMVAKFGVAALKG